MDKQEIKIPESTLRSIKEARETFKKLQDNIKSIVPKINIPKFDPPSFENIKLTPPVNMDVVQGENNWIRHNEILKTQNTLLNVLKEILSEQQSTSKMTKTIIWLTVGLFFLTIITIIATLLT